MLVQPLPEGHLDHAGSVVTDDFLEVLQAAPQHDQAGHGDQRPGKAGERGAFVDHFHDDDGSNGQPRDSRGNCQHPDYRGQEDA